MLQFDTLPPSFAALLVTLRPCFTAPSFRTFTALVAGMVAQPGRHTVTGMLSAAGLAGIWHHSRAHWFFTHARWCADTLGLAVLTLIVQHLVPPGEALLVAVDDTLFHRSGRKVHATAWHHDGAAKGPGTKVAWGNNWVIAAIVLTLPILDRPVSLPVAFALWSKGGPTKQVLLARLVTRIATTCPDRQIDVVADSHYAGADGAPGAATGANRDRGLPAGITLTSRLRANAILNAIATPVPGKGGRPKRIGAKLGTPKQLAAATTTWITTQVSRYGRTDTVQISDTHCLWYGAYRSREVRVILIREPGSKTKTGYDLALITTDLTTPAEQLITRYAARWSIEVANEDAKQITGVGQARNRTRTAVTRTVPFGLLTQTLVVLWYTQHGHHHTTVTQRRAQAPWYRQKTQPAYHDMIIKLRRTLIAARFLRGKPRNPTPEETHTIHLAWAEATG
ncbi:MAG: transposase [Pseudonocardia sp.]|nr:transposase [Pseudonocardia sp.]